MGDSTDSARHTSRETSDWSKTFRGSGERKKRVLVMHPCPEEDLARPVQAWSRCEDSGCSFWDLTFPPGLWLSVFGRGVWGIHCQRCLTYLSADLAYLTPVLIVYKVLYFLENLLDISHQLWETSWSQLLLLSSLFLTPSPPTPHFAAQTNILLVWMVRLYQPGCILEPGLAFHLRSQKKQLGEHLILTLSSLLLNHVLGFYSSSWL